MKTERYDIQAKLPEGATRGQVPAMLQALRAQRFNLKVPRESRERSVYARVVAKDGPKLKPAENPPEAAAAPAAPPGQIRGGLSVGPGGQMVSMGAGSNVKTTPGPDGNLHIESKNTTMAGLLGFIGRYCDLPVLDMTELKGSYDFEIDITGEEIRNAARAHGAVIRTSDQPSEPTGITLRQSLQKLGLKLEARKVPMEVLVADDALKVPTEN
jgi:uncharacterized protein (TIGR03435 family)